MQTMMKVKKKIITGDEMGLRVHIGSQKRHCDSKKKNRYKLGQM